MAEQQKMVHIPWYATGFRNEMMREALAEIAPVALRYGATEYHVFQALDDRYKFLQLAAFQNKLDFERYWLGEEFVAWRARYTGKYQVPVLYGFHDHVTRGALDDLEQSERSRVVPVA